MGISRFGRPRQDAPVPGHLVASVRDPRRDAARRPGGAGRPDPRRRGRAVTAPSALANPTSTITLAVTTRAGPSLRAFGVAPA